MNFGYTSMPDGSTARPLVDVYLNGSSDGFVGLVDTGSVNTVFDRWVAEFVGIELADADLRRLSIGGRTYETAFVTTELSAAGHTWEAEVGFASGWQPGWGLLGDRSFLRFFTLTVRAADQQFELVPIDR